LSASYTFFRNKSGKIGQKELRCVVKTKFGESLGAFSIDVSQFAAMPGTTKKAGLKNNDGLVLAISFCATEEDVVVGGDPKSTGAAAAVKAEKTDNAAAAAAKAQQEKKEAEEKAKESEREEAEAVRKRESAEASVDKESGAKTLSMDSFLSGSSSASKSGSSSSSSSSSSGGGGSSSSSSSGGEEQEYEVLVPMIQVREGLEMDSAKLCTKTKGEVFMVVDRQV
jgi:hypothetical protein